VLHRAVFHTYTNLARSLLQFERARSAHLTVQVAPVDCQDHGTDQDNTAFKGLKLQPANDV
jgi:hypothetical protein